MNVNKKNRIEANLKHCSFQIPLKKKFYICYYFWKLYNLKYFFFLKKNLCIQKVLGAVFHEYNVSFTLQII